MDVSRMEQTEVLRMEQRDGCKMLAAAPTHLAVFGDVDGPRLLDVALQSKLMVDPDGAVDPAAVHEVILRL